MDEIFPGDEGVKKGPEIGILEDADSLWLNSAGLSAIEMVHVSKNFDVGQPALTDITLRIEKGKFVYLLGPNGAGKTTLFKLLYAAERPTEGELWVNGFEVHEIKFREIPLLRRSLGIVFQDLKLISRWSAFENIAFALRALAFPKKEIEERTLQTLKEVGLDGKRNFLVHQLSAGERQKVAIARAMVHPPELLLADEPTGNIDLRAAEEILRLFDSIHLRGTTILFATHDEGLTAALPKERVVLEGGRIVESSLNPCPPSGSDPNQSNSPPRGEEGDSLQIRQEV